MDVRATITKKAAIPVMAKNPFAVTSVFPITAMAKAK